MNGQKMGLLHLWVLGAAFALVNAGGGAALAQTLPDAAPPPPVDQAQDPNRGAVTNLPLPRYVTLKTNEGNARRGPGLTHRIDWVFTRAGMPLRITAEYENWRRVEDADGLGGWVHFALLSGVRAVLITQAMTDFHATPQETAPIVLRAEADVIAKLLECQPDWCRLNVNGEKGLVRKAALWGVEADEIVE
ncbi:MAG: SH3 domain-containing protein [Paracoccaceae bacterium]|nr:SH3 domain-containing protein [Paracoccaceae bacterium]